jgi:hypothetical protein
MLIPKWVPYEKQMCQLGKHHWSVSRLVDLSKDLEIIDAPLDLISVNSVYECLRLRDFVMHMKAIEDADLSYPIILDEDGELMDGRHRIMKAMMLGNETIKVVRFQKNPSPCREGE